ncbi:MAG: hypothetical protein AAGH19_05900 [Pseudomonadota bacterium]
MPQDGPSVAVELIRPTLVRAPLKPEPIEPKSIEPKPIEPEPIERQAPMPEPEHVPAAGDEVPEVPSRPLLEPVAPVVSTTPAEPPVVIRQPVEDMTRDQALLTRLRAAPLERDPGEGLFGYLPPEQETPTAFQFPERESMIDYLTPELPELPFADPGLDVFMYAGGWKGDLHRGFDQITPEFGWRSNTGFIVRCRWVIIAIGCGWGRQPRKPTPLLTPEILHQQRQAQEQEQVQERDQEREETG